MVSYFTNRTTQIENTVYKAFLGEDAKVCIAHESRFRRGNELDSSFVDK